MNQIMDRFVALVVLILLTFLQPGLTHTMGMGSCPKVDPVKDFNMDQFMGEWFVVQKFATSSSCMRYNFTKGDDGKMRLVQTRQHFLFNTVGLDHTYTYTGVLTVPEADATARMRVKFPLNVAGESEFVVFMTDYANYAGIFTCQKILFGHSKSATILSRKPTLDKVTINQIRQKLEEEGVDPDDFSIVDQSSCITKKDANFNVKIDDKTFSAGNVASVVKTAGGYIGSGVQKAGDVIGSGITKAADVTSGIVESFGEEKKGNRPRKILDDLLDMAKSQDNDAEWIA